MYDIKELEKEWETYNKRRKQPWYVFIAFFFLFILIIVLWFNKKNNEPINKPMVITEVNKTIVANSGNMINKTQAKPHVEVTENQVILDSTNQDTPTGIKIDSSKPQTGENSNTDHAPYSIAQNEPVLEEVESLNQIVTTSENTSDKKSDKQILQINISDILTTNAFEDVENRFYETKDTDDSLFLARSYFNKGDYNKALYWALQTNQVNDSIEEAWLIFAESKYKMGDKGEAIKILKSYIQRSNSVKAKALLERLE